MTKPGWQYSVINVTLTYQGVFPALNTNQKPRIESPRNQQNSLGGSPDPFLPVHYIKNIWLRKIRTTAPNATDFQNSVILISYINYKIKCCLFNYIDMCAGYTFKFHVYLYIETIDNYVTVSPTIIYQSAETTHVSL